MKSILKILRNVILGYLLIGLFICQLSQILMSLRENDYTSYFTSNVGNVNFFIISFILISIFLLPFCSGALSNRNSKRTYVVLFFLRVLVLANGIFVSKTDMKKLAVIDIVANLMILLIVVPIVKLIRKTIYEIVNKRSIISSSNIKYSEDKNIKKELEEKIGVKDEEIVKDKLYNIFVEFEKSYNNLDYSMIKFLCSDQIYRKYCTGLDVQRGSNLKRIIDNIEKKKIIILNVDSNSIYQRISTLIKISYINYVVDKNGKIVKGSRYIPTIEEFEVIFTKNHQKNREKTNCLNCGAPIEAGSVKCKCCSTQTNNDDFKISSIRKIV